jgi:hypothetical protein
MTISLVGRHALTRHTLHRSAMLWLLQALVGVGPVIHLR